MVIYNVSKIDPILVPLLRSDFIVEGNLSVQFFVNMFIFTYFNNMYFTIIVGKKIRYQTKDNNTYLHLQKDIKNKNSLVYIKVQKH